MRNNIIIYTLVPVVFFTALFIGQGPDEQIDINMYTVNENMDYTVEEIDQSEQVKLDAIESAKACFASPRLGKTFVGFKEALAFKESRGDYRSVNTLGYMGKYQFGKGTLELIGIYNTSEFLNDPELQEKAFIANAMRNKWVLRRDIKRFVGKRIDGVQVTESGILAAAHLAGPGSVKKYLRSYGAIGFADAYGTTIRNYMKKFSGYDTSFIHPDRKAKASKI